MTLLQLCTPVNHRPDLRTPTATGWRCGDESVIIHQRPGKRWLIDYEGPSAAWTVGVVAESVANAILKAMETEIVLRQTAIDRGWKPCLSGWMDTAGLQPVQRVGRNFFVAHSSLKTEGKAGEYNRLRPMTEAEALRLALQNPRYSGPIPNRINPRAFCGLCGDPCDYDHTCERPEEEPPEPMPDPF